MGARQLLTPPPRAPITDSEIHVPQLFLFSLPLSSQGRLPTHEVLSWIACPPKNLDTDTPAQNRTHNHTDDPTDHDTDANNNDGKKETPSDTHRGHTSGNLKVYVAEGHATDTAAHPDRHTENIIIPQPGLTVVLPLSLPPLSRSPPSSSATNPAPPLDSHTFLWGIDEVTGDGLAAAQDRESHGGGGMGHDRQAKGDVYVLVRANWYAGNCCREESIDQCNSVEVAEDAGQERVGIEDEQRVEMLEEEGREEGEEEDRELGAEGAEERWETMIMPVICVCLFERMQSHQ